MRARTCLVAVVMTCGFVSWLQAPAMAGCEAASSLTQAQGECRRDGDQVRNLYATAASEGYTYRMESRCKPGDECGREERICRTEAGRPGTWYVLIRTTVSTGAQTRMGIVCLTPADEEDLAVITPAMVRREMQRLAWPAADLEIQPPDGETLVNFETNFFTDHTRPVTRTITLLGQRVSIEATPVEYRWHFGDGTTRVTTGPGAPYPDLDITHPYAATGTVQPRVDTTYRGRYRINDDGWQDVPGSLTVRGEPVPLRIRSATPHLVGSDTRH